MTALVRLEDGWARWYCGPACATDPTFGAWGALPAPRGPADAPAFCARCGLPVGNRLSPRGRALATALAAETAGWQAEALRDSYGLREPSAGGGPRG